MTTKSNIKANVFQTMIENKKGLFLDLFDKSLNDKDLGEQKDLVFGLMVHLEAYGYTLSPQIVNILSNFSKEKVELIGTTVVKVVEKMSGGDKVFQPMYPNFPKQVLEASELELFVNAMVHYTGDFLGVRILPKYNKEQRDVLSEDVKPKMIGYVSFADVQKYFENLLTSNVVLSESQKESFKTLCLFLKEKGLLDTVVENSNIPQKENLAFIGSLYLKNDWNFAVVSNNFKTTTDVLRLIVAYSDGDISLAKHSKIANLSRGLRKEILSLLENINNNSDDKDQINENIFKYKSRWVRVAHALHIGEYQNKFPNVVNLLQKARDNDKSETFNSKVEKSYTEENYNETVELLKARPGVFARNLFRLLVDESFVMPKKKKQVKVKQNFNMSHLKQDSLKSAIEIKIEELKQQLDSANIVLEKQKSEVVKPTVNSDVNVVNNSTKFNINKSDIVNAFAGVVNKVATPVLLQLHAHFKNLVENENITTRSFMPKGGTASVFIVKDISAQYDKKYLKDIIDVVEKSLVERFKNLPSLGNVYLDESLKTQNIPFAQRSASKALSTVARGSSFDVEKDSNLRLMLWWKEKEGERCDIDLSATFLDENFKTINSVGYYNLRHDSTGSVVHSGDITSAPDGACEFIDIDKTKLDSDINYIVMTLNCYTGQKYANLPECFAGWMDRVDLEKGEIFEAKTVKNKIDLASDVVSIIPMIYDVKNNKMIWADMAFAKEGAYNNNRNQHKTIENIVEAIVDMKKPNLYDLFSLHVQARGSLVTDKSKADTIFSIDEGVTPFMFDVISSEYMSNVESKPQIKMKKSK